MKKHVLIFVFVVFCIWMCNDTDKNVIDNTPWKTCGKIGKIDFKSIISEADTVYNIVSLDLPNKIGCIIINSQSQFQEVFRNDNIQPDINFRENTIIGESITLLKCHDYQVERLLMFHEKNRIYIYERDITVKENVEYLDSISSTYLNDSIPLDSDYKRIIDWLLVPKIKPDENIFILNNTSYESTPNG